MPSPQVAQPTTWTLQAKRRGPWVSGPAWLRTRAGVQASLAQANILVFRGARLENVGDRRRGLLSRFLSVEAKRLKVKRPPGACPSTQAPRAPVHAVSAGCVPSEAPAE